MYINVAYEHTQRMVGKWEGKREITFLYIFIDIYEGLPSKHEDPEFKPQYCLPSPPKKINSYSMKDLSIESKRAGKEVGRKRNYNVNILQRQYEFRLNEHVLNKIF
jgi:hypothetical protein